MTTDTTDTITAYRDGRFTTEPRPEWWEAETNVPLPEQEPIKLGDEFGFNVETMPLLAGHGHYVAFLDQARCIDVWAPTTADLLTLLTGPAATYCNLRTGPMITDLTADIRNLLCSYFRHGSGEHIDRITGQSRIDQREDDEQRRLRRVGAGE